MKKLDGKLVNFVGYEFDIIRILDNGTERSAHAWEMCANKTSSGATKRVHGGILDFVCCSSGTFTCS